MTLCVWCRHPASMHRGGRECVADQCDCLRAKGPTMEITIQPDDCLCSVHHAPGPDDEHSNPECPYSTAYTAAEIEEGIIRALTARDIGSRHERKRSLS